MHIRIGSPLPGGLWTSLHQQWRPFSVVLSGLMACCHCSQSRRQQCSRHLPRRRRRHRVELCARRRSIASRGTGRGQDRRMRSHRGSPAGIVPGHQRRPRPAHRDHRRQTHHLAGYPPTWHWTPWQRRSSVGIRSPAMSANRIRHARTITRTGPRGSRPSTMRSSRATDHYDSGGVHLVRPAVPGRPDPGSVDSGWWRRIAVSSSGRLPCHRSAGGIGGCTPPADSRCASGGPRISAPCSAAAAASAPKSGGPATWNSGAIFAYR